MCLMLQKFKMIQPSQSALELVFYNDFFVFSSVANSSTPPGIHNLLGWSAI